MSQVITDRIANAPRWAFEWGPLLTGNDLTPKRKLSVRFKGHQAAKTTFDMDALTDMAREYGHAHVIEQLAAAVWARFDKGTTTFFERPEFIMELTRWLTATGLP